MSKPARIMFNRPSLIGTEFDYVREAANAGQFSGDGIFTKRCSDLLKNELGTQCALLTPSCTHALEMAAILLELQPGDEVIIPSFTYVSTANAFVLHGAKPVFIDIRPDTLNLDESKLEELITPRTRAIVPVHYAGVGCEMDTILEIAARHDIAVVEDNAHGLFGRYKNRALGTLGHFGTLSFHETKNFNCGEGGAILINDPRYVERAEIIREKGTNRCQFFRGAVAKYTWVDVGSSYLLSDILAAFLFAQLEARAQIESMRKAVWVRYHEGLSEIAQEFDLQLPSVPDECQQPYHMYYMLLPNLEVRQALIASLRARGILSVFHYQPLHDSEMGQKLGGAEYPCPVTDRVSDQLLRLPFYNELTESDQDEVIDGIRTFFRASL
jgi:dTDP-4-amino-4,6-dideoxygalactose transaminase